MVELNLLDHTYKGRNSRNNSQVKTIHSFNACGVGWGNSIVRSGLCDGASGWASWENE